MAASVTSQVEVRISGQYTNTVGLQEVAAPLALVKTIPFANGTGLNQADKVYSQQYSIGTGATQSIDVAGSLTDSMGVAFTPAKIKAIYIGSASTNTTNLTVFGDAAHVPFLGTVATSLTLRPGGAFLLVDPGTTAYAVTAATGDIIKIVNAAGATAVVDLIVIAASA